MHHRTRGESPASGASRGQRLKGLLSLQVCHCPIHSRTCVGSLQLLRQIDAQPASSRYLQVFRQTGEGNNMTMNENTKKYKKYKKKHETKHVLDFLYQSTSLYATRIPSLMHADMCQ